MHSITYGQAVVLGLLQGASELFPVSSLGHSVIVPKLLGWDIPQSDDAFLTFLVATHLATALVLFGFFWRDWMRILFGDDRRLLWLLVAATIPAGLLGLAFEHPLRHVFGSPLAAAIFLFGNGLMLFAAERLRRDDTRVVEALSFPKAFAIGATQAIALLPGFSRSGAAMAGGLRAGHRLRVGAVPLALLRNPHAEAVRDLLHRRRVRTNHWTVHRTVKGC